jgi:hypothetical protein
VLPGEMTGAFGRLEQPGSPHDIGEPCPYVVLHRCRGLPRGIAFNVGTREPEIIAPNRRLNVGVAPCAASGGRRVPAPPDRRMLQTEIFTDGGAKGVDLPGTCRVLHLQVIVSYRFLLDCPWVRSWVPLSSAEDRRRMTPVAPTNSVVAGACLPLRKHPFGQRSLSTRTGSARVQVASQP